MLNIKSILKQAVKFVVALAVVSAAFVGVMMVALRTSSAGKELVDAHGMEVFSGLWVPAAVIFAVAYALYPWLKSKVLHPESRLVSAGFFLGFYVILYFIVAFAAKLFM